MPPVNAPAETSPTLLKAQTVLKDLAAAAETEYPISSRIGVPGKPGTVDLVNALRRLTPKRDDSTQETDNNVSGTTEGGHGWRTPDSMLSTGSRSACSNSVQYPEKLKVRNRISFFFYSCPKTNADGFLFSFLDHQAA